MILLKERHELCLFVDSSKLGSGKYKSTEKSLLVFILQNSTSQGKGCTLKMVHTSNVPLH